MDNNCFYKHLDREIGDDSFPVFGIVLIENVSSKVYGTAGKTFYVTPKSGTVTLNGSTITEKTAFTGEATIGAADASFTIEVYYDLAKGMIDAEHFSYITNPADFSLYGDFSKFVSIPKTSMRRINFGVADRSQNHVEMLRILQNCPELTYIESHWLSFTATMQQIGEVFPYTCTEWWVPFDVSTITGTVESFVQVMRTRQAAAGVSQTGNMALRDIKLPNVTFNGETHGWTSTTLSWTASTITCYGVTINV